jgi:HlyD family secretion protein
MKTRRHWFYFGGALLVIALAIIAVWPRAVEVEAASVDRGAVRATIVDEGRTRMREVYVVSAPVPGRLLRVAVEPGDIVVEGEPLARMTRSVAGFLDPRSDAEARAVVNAAEARETAARAERELAEIEASRAETLATQRLIATAALDTARTRLRAARAAESAASAELRRARSALLAAGRDGESSTLTLNAPSAGVVLRVPQESEATVAAGTPVVVLGDPSRLDVIAEFLSQDAVRVQRGDRAFIENWGEQGLGLPPIPATVERIEPVARTKVSALGIEEQRANVVLRFAAPPPAPLRAHDFRVDARVVVAESQGALRVPLGALFRRDGGWAVYRERGGRAEAVPVQVGIQDATHREVSAGLAEGERVVLFPSAEVQPGARLRPRP